MEDITHYVLRLQYITLTPRSIRLDLFVKKAFLKISQNSQENTCVEIFFLITLQASGL